MNCPTCPTRVRQGEPRVSDRPQGYLPGMLAGDSAAALLFLHWSGASGAASARPGHHRRSTSLRTCPTRLSEVGQRVGQRFRKWGSRGIGGRSLGTTGSEGSGACPTSCPSPERRVGQENRPLTSSGTTAAPLAPLQCAIETTRLQRTDGMTRNLTRAGEPA